MLKPSKQFIARQRARDMLARSQAKKTLRDIGLEYGISGTRVRQILHRFFGHDYHNNPVERP